MSWWQKMFGGASEKPSATDATQPRVVEVLPGKLSVRVQSHRMRFGPEDFPCWSYVTAGLQKFGQKELIFTLRCEPHENAANFPTDPLNFFSQVCGLAEQGRVVDVGAYTGFRMADGFLGKQDVVGMAYVAPQPLDDVELPSPTESLAAILLTAEEVEVVAKIGSYRVLTLLGLANRYYPCPPWSDRQRKPVVTCSDFGESLLSKMGSIYMGEATARTFLPSKCPTADDRALSPAERAVGLRLSRNLIPEIQQLLAQLPASGGVALLTSPDPEANARMVWSPGKELPPCITPPESDGSCLTGGFVALLYGEPCEDEGILIEDGFAVTMCAATWEQVSQALRTGTSIRFTGSRPEKRGFELEWYDDVSKSGQAMTPAATGKPPAFKVAQLFLYQPDNVLKQRLPSTDVFVKHTMQAMQLSEAYWETVPDIKPQVATLFIAVKPGRRARFWAEFKPGGIAEDIIDAWFKRLAEIPVPVVYQGPVAVAIHAHLGGATGGGWEFMPNEWKLKTDGQRVVPDDILKVIWPS